MTVCQTVHVGWIDIRETALGWYWQLSNLVAVPVEDLRSHYGILKRTRGRYSLCKVEGMCR